MSENTRTFSDSTRTFSDITRTLSEIPRVTIEKASLQRKAILFLQNQVNKEAKEQNKTKKNNCNEAIFFKFSFILPVLESILA